MKTLSVLATFLIGMTLLLGMAACTPGAAPDGTAPNDPAQSGQATAATAVPASQQQQAGSSASISCDKIIPPDEAKSLMTGLSPVLSEEAGQGEITCTWQYTSKVSGQAAAFKLQVGYGGSAVDTWQAARKSELAGQAADLVVNSIDGLRDENYIWTSKPDNQTVVYVRRGTQTMIMHYQAPDILFMGTESGIIDMADRMFDRLGS